MRYRPEHYARAFAELVGETPPERHRALIRRLVATVARRGDLDRIGLVLRLVEQELVRRRGGRWVTFEFARPAPERRLATLARALARRDRIEAKVTPELIAGVRVTIDGERELDLSLRRALRALFGTRAAPLIR